MILLFLSNYLQFILANKYYLKMIKPADEQSLSADNNLFKEQTKEHKLSQYSEFENLLNIKAEDDSFKIVLLKEYIHNFYKKLVDKPGSAGCLVSYFQDKYSQFQKGVNEITNENNVHLINQLYRGIHTLINQLKEINIEELKKENQQQRLRQVDIVSKIFKLQSRPIQAGMVLKNYEYILKNKYYQLINRKSENISFLGCIMNLTQIQYFQINQEMAGQQIGNIKWIIQTMTNYLQNYQKNNHKFNFQEVLKITVIGLRYCCQKSRLSPAYGKKLGYFVSYTIDKDYQELKKLNLSRDQQQYQLAWKLEKIFYYEQRVQIYKKYVSNDGTVKKMDLQLRNILQSLVKNRVEAVKSKQSIRKVKDEVNKCSLLMKIKDKIKKNDFKLKVQNFIKNNFECFRQLFGKIKQINRNDSKFKEISTVMQSRQLIYKLGTKNLITKALQAQKCNLKQISNQINQYFERFKNYVLLKLQFMQKLDCYQINKQTKQKMETIQLQISQYTLYQSEFSKINLNYQGLKMKFHQKIIQNVFKFLTSGHYQNLIDICNNCPYEEIQKDIRLKFQQNIKDKAQELQKSIKEYCYQNQLSKKIEQDIDKLLRLFEINSEIQLLHKQQKRSFSFYDYLLNLLQYLRSLIQQLVEMIRQNLLKCQFQIAQLNIQKIRFIEKQLEKFNTNIFTDIFLRQIQKINQILKLFLIEPIKDIQAEFKCKFLSYDLNDKISQTLLKVQKQLQNNLSKYEKWQIFQIDEIFCKFYQLSQKKEDFRKINKLKQIIKAHFGSLFKTFSQQLQFLDEQYINTQMKICKKIESLPESLRFQYKISYSQIKENHRHKLSRNCRNQPRDLKRCLKIPSLLKFQSNQIQQQLLKIIKEKVERSQLLDQYFDILDQYFKPYFPQIQKSSQMYEIFQNLLTKMNDRIDISLKLFKRSMNQSIDTSQKELNIIKSTYVKLQDIKVEFKTTIFNELSKKIKQYFYQYIQEFREKQKQNRQKIKQFLQGNKQIIYQLKKQNIKSVIMKKVSDMFNITKMSSIQQLLQEQIFSVIAALKEMDFNIVKEESDEKLQITLKKWSSYFDFVNNPENKIILLRNEFCCLIISQLQSVRLISCQKIDDFLLKCSYSRLSTKDLTRKILTRVKQHSLFNINRSKIQNIQLQLEKYQKQNDNLKVQSRQCSQSSMVISKQNTSQNNSFCSEKMFSNEKKCTYNISNTKCGQRLEQLRELAFKNHYQFIASLSSNQNEFIANYNPPYNFKKDQFDWTMQLGQQAQPYLKTKYLDCIISIAYAIKQLEQLGIYHADIALRNIIYTKKQFQRFQNIFKFKLIDFDYAFQHKIIENHISKQYMNQNYETTKKMLEMMKESKDKSQYFYTYLFRRHQRAQEQNIQNGSIQIQTQYLKSRKISQIIQELKLHALHSHLKQYRSLISTILNIIQKQKQDIIFKPIRDEIQKNMQQILYLQKINLYGNFAQKMIQLKLRIDEKDQNK